VLYGNNPPHPRTPRPTHLRAHPHQSATTSPSGPPILSRHPAKREAPAAITRLAPGCRGPRGRWGRRGLLIGREQAAYRLGIGRSTAYQLISTGQLTSIRIGNLRRIPVEALAFFVDSMMNGAEGTDGPFSTTSAARG